MSGSRTRLQAAAEAGSIQGPIGCDKQNLSNNQYAQSPQLGCRVFRFHEWCNMIIWHRIKQYRVDRGKDCLHALLFTLQLQWHYYLTPHHTSSIIPLDSCLRRGCRWYNTTLTRKVLPPITDNMLCRWYIFHHSTHTSPYFRQIGKHIWHRICDCINKHIDKTARPWLPSR